MITRALSMKAKQAIWKVKEQKSLIRTTAQKFRRANTTIWNILKKKETASVLSNKRPDRPRKIIGVDDSKLIRAVNKNPKQLSVTSPTTSKLRG